MHRNHLLIISFALPALSLVAIIFYYYFSMYAYVVKTCEANAVAREKAIVMHRIMASMNTSTLPMTMNVVKSDCVPLGNGMYGLPKLIHGREIVLVFSASKSLPNGVSRLERHSPWLEWMFEIPIDR